jgi:hypothetical protein
MLVCGERIETMTAKAVLREATAVDAKGAPSWRKYCRQKNIRINATPQTITKKRLQYVLQFTGWFSNRIESLTMLHTPVAFIGRCSHLRSHQKQKS